MTRESFTCKGLTFHWNERLARYESKLETVGKPMLSALVLVEFPQGWYGCASLVRGAMENTREAAIVSLLEAIVDSCKDHVLVINEILSAP